MLVIVDEVEVCDHFAEDRQNRRVLFDNRFIRRLNEKLVERGTLHADLMANYEQFVEMDNYKNKMQAILEYLQARMAESKLNLQQATHGVDIVTRRNLLTRVASSPFQRNSNYDPGYTLTAYKLNGVIFLCELMDRRPEPVTEEEIAEEERVVEKRKQNAYIVAKLNQGLTLAETQKNPSFEVVSSNTIAWNVVSTLRMTDESTQHAHRLLIASTASAIDKYNEYVQIIPIHVNKTPKPVDVLVDRHLYPNLQLRFFLNALLGGQQRVIGGVFLRPYYHLKQIVDFDGLVLLEHAKEWNANECLKYLFDLLSQIRTVLNAVPEGTLIHVERPKRDPNHKLRLIDEAERSTFDFVGDEFRDFVRHMETK